MSCTRTSKDDIGYFSNTATTGGALWVGSGATVSSETSDWGSGGDNNDPDDLYLSLTGGGVDFGDGETFSCGASGCN